MKTRELAAIVAAMLLLSSMTVAHARNGGSEGSLKGVHRVFVSVHVEGKSLASSGLTDPQVREAVVLRLRLAGIGVLNEEEWKKTPGKPYLYVSLNDTLLSGQMKRPGGYVCTCSFDLMEEVTPAREPRVLVDACTWSRGATLIVPVDGGAQVRMLVDNLAKDFGDAVVAANNNVLQSTQLQVPLEKR